MKIICIGRNYTEHIEELANEKPTDPVIFMKPDSAVLRGVQIFYIPDFSGEIHYEVEVLVKINKVGKHIDTKFAHKYYDEIGLGIDLTARDLQSKLKAKGLPWEKAKAFDGSAIVGNWLPKDSLGDVNDLNFKLLRNGKAVQNGNTSLMLWKIDELISYISMFFTLKKGDIIFTGTPAGVGRVSPDDHLEGFLEEKKLLSLKVR
ncbi:fumarylacetoacetate hydrolase family protein [Galbibacter sp. EGI 63066]|uniref:fumarylacetoacetate hydrolase family protein n=1 Tax=Galbibacter sp. EGI 63066 TaxID=2993559 RepID=UPI002248A316|nr:fumarylacetoacetate hydrolase family protein [Galbibacter sp. EGI 63066]MCX2681592.1 fumarylacetoacetate hydrolase family protein [Galbibacter sp. EGI 63066]